MTSLDIIRIISAGGEVAIDCREYSIIDLLRFANAASQSENNPLLVFRNSEVLTTLDMVRIANANSGHVFLTNYGKGRDLSSI